MRRLKALLLGNIELKVLSLIIAVLLWYIISAKGVSEMSIEVPVEYINIPQGYELLEKNTDKVRITLFGSERILRTLRPEDLRVTVDLKGMAEGQILYQLGEKDVRVPSAITISEVYPRQIRLYLDRSQTKEVPVRVVLPESLRSKYQILVEPERVKISGPGKIVEGIKYVRAEDIDVSEIGKQQRLIVRLVSPHKRIRFLQDTVTITIRPKEEGT